jgi:serine/threonine protein kinase
MVVGSPAYQAPEALDDSYGDEPENAIPGAGPQKEDVWALGITLYQMLFLKLPFVGSNLFEIVNAIREKPFKIPEGTDPLVVKLLCGMINVDPVKRFSIEEVLEHPLVRNANQVVSDLPIAQSPKGRHGEVRKFEAKVCQEGNSFAEIALTIKRRPSLQHYGFGHSMETMPNRKLTKRSSDGDLPKPEFGQFVRKFAESEQIDFTRKCQSNSGVDRMQG